MDGMDRRNFLAWSAGSLAALGAGGAAARESADTPKRPPNFVVIMADDMGAKELGCYGHPEHETPNLDRLAKSGVQFRTAYASPICHPSRVMLLTGQYGFRNGVYNFAGRRGGPEANDAVEDIGANHFTFAEMLKGKGYATALAGKWQLSGKPPTLIHDCGFDEYCVWAYKHNLPEGVEHKGGWEKANKPARYWHPCVMRNGEYVPTKPEDYGPDIYTDFLIDFAKRHKDEPFLLYYPMCLTHSPHERTPDTMASEDRKYDRKAARFRYAVEYTDTLVGRLVAALDELGLRENTVVLFMGDNGTGGQGKAQPTELGARVPMIVNAPGVVRCRGETDALTDLSDVLPTLADFADVPLPKDRPIDGHSLAPFLRGDAQETRDWIFSFIADRRILRTERWLLEDNSPLHYGHLYDCGKTRDGTGYHEVTDSKDPAVLAAKQHFDRLLRKLPAPYIEYEGDAAAHRPGEKKAKGK